MGRELRSFVGHQMNESVLSELLYQFKLSADESRLPGAGAQVFGPHAQRRFMAETRPGFRVDVGIAEEVHLRTSDELGDERVLRPFVQIHRSPHLFDSSIPKDDDPVGQGHGFDLVMGDVDHGRPQTFMEPRDLDPGLDAKSRIEVGQRLVEKKDFRRPYDGASDGHALPLSTRQVFRASVQKFRDLQNFGAAARTRRSISSFGVFACFRPKAMFL